MDTCIPRSGTAFFLIAPRGKQHGSVLQRTGHGKRAKRQSTIMQPEEEMNLENTTLSKISDTQKKPFCMVPRNVLSRQAKSQQQKIESPREHGMGE